MGSDKNFTSGILISSFPLPLYVGFVDFDVPSVNYCFPIIVPNNLPFEFFLSFIRYSRNSIINLITCFKIWFPCPLSVLRIYDLFLIFF